MSDNAVSASWRNIELRVEQMEDEIAQAAQDLSKGVVLFGAGPNGRAVQRYLTGLGAHIVAFVDNNSAKWGQRMEGVPVMAPQEILGDMPVFIAARHAVLPIRRQLNGMGIRNLSFDAFFVSTTLNRIRNMRDELFTDDHSRHVVDGILLSMLTGDESHCAAIMDRNQFFAIPEFSDPVADVFIDAGAYVGDTVERYLWAHNGIVREIHAFEPGRPQFEALCTRSRRLVQEWALGDSTIVCVNAGLAEQDKQMRMSISAEMLQTSFLSDGADGNSALVDIRSLDTYLDSRPATFIKADIEGMEMPMLRGARHTIQTYRPKMALSVYHEPTDLFEIAEYVKDAAPGYRMALRHHAASLVDSVLYCWMKK